MGWFLWSCHWSTTHTVQTQQPYPLPSAIVAFANSPLIHTNFTGVPHLEFTPDLREEKMRFVFYFKNARGKDGLKQWVYLLFCRCFVAEFLPTATAVQIGSGQGVSTSLITSCKEKSEGEQEPPVPVPSGFLAIRHGASRDVPSICPVPCVTVLPLFLAICVEGMTVIFLTARKKKRYSNLPAVCIYRYLL